MDEKQSLNPNKKGDHERICKTKIFNYFVETKSSSVI